MLRGRRLQKHQKYTNNQWDTICAWTANVVEVAIKLFPELFCCDLFTIKFLLMACCERREKKKRIYLRSNLSNMNKTIMSKILQHLNWENWIFFVFSVLSQSFCSLWGLFDEFGISRKKRVGISITKNTKLICFNMHNEYITSFTLPSKRDLRILWKPKKHIEQQHYFLFFPFFSDSDNGAKNDKCVHGALNIKDTMAVFTWTASNIKCEIRFKYLIVF